MQKVNITEWRLTYWPLGTERRVLFGVPENHPGPFVLNGDFIISSEIAVVDLKNRKVITQNTEYNLIGPELELYEFHRRVDLMLGNKYGTY
jgi:hypothetical protein